MISDELLDLGWSQSQDALRIGMKLRAGGILKRVTAVHKTEIDVAPSQGKDESRISLTGPWLNVPSSERPIVGDWLLIDPLNKTSFDLLPRRNILQRSSPDPGKTNQLMAANIDACFIVSSCLEDFNIDRLERYVALAAGAEIRPVLVLTKSDLTDNTSPLKRDLKKAFEEVETCFINALDLKSCQQLMKFLGRGRTVALMGSSGVGKSSLVNTMLGQDKQATRSTRSFDGKGRHATTARSAHVLPSGGVVIDNPGIREVQVVETTSSIKDSFKDIQKLAKDCRFSDCRHQSEPDCAVQAGIESGLIDMRRLENYLKLLGQK